MSERIQQLTLKELCTNAERLCRELMDHLDRGVLPKSHELGKLAAIAPGSEEDVPDVRLRSQAQLVLTTQEFTKKLTQKLVQYLEAMDNAARQQVNS